MSSSRGGGAPAQIGELVNIINELRESLKSYRKELEKNEALVRYCIVDPLLRALGWDLRNPNQVVPEYTVSRGKKKMRLDYLLRDAEGKPFVAIEVKALDKVEEAEKEVFSAIRESKAKFAVITDGKSWHLYEYKQSLSEPPRSKWNLLEDSPEEVVDKVRVIARKDFGKAETEISPRPPPAPGLRCPYCGFVGKFRLLKTWKYRIWDVYFYECPKCGGRFNHYIGVTSEGERSEFVIRIRSRTSGGAR